ncbi:hypothetical protein GOP47_0013101 [Adiantum capillus-veneris]|uniref:Uncharacterized protein n=1 Tax=Adiantum capillus-veneris TaxID=13818 RepID=A0A9D4USC4_ADICA|nr:hypothetical protein GOP47_0013101 [Adiantum capillus-veneris]
MPPLCAENNSLLACMASSARQEASLVAIAQQFMQQQHHQHKHNNAHATSPYHPQHPLSSSLHLTSMDHWAPSSCWQQAKTEDFANSFYSDSLCDISTYASSSVIDLPASGLMMPSLDCHIDPESEFSMPSSVAGVKPLEEEDPLLCCHTPELSQTLTSVHESGELVDGLLSNTNAVLLSNTDGTGQPSAGFGGGFVDTTSEWFDCLMDENMASCFEPIPCESTQSSEPVASIDYLPCTPFDEALPDGFAFMEAENLCNPKWSSDPGNEMTSGTYSQDLMGAMCAPLVRPDTMGACTTSQDVLGLCGVSPDVANMCAASSLDMLSMHLKRGRAAGGGNLHEVKKEGCKVSSSSTTSGERVRMQHRPSQVPSHGVQLMQLLLECAKAVENDHKKAEIVIPQLKAQATRHGDPIQRLAAYFTEALCKRLARAQGRGDVECAAGGECSPQELTLAYKAMNEACPYFTFAQLTANQAILEAIEGAESVHIVDFGISQGVQWAAMLQAIAAQEGRRPPNRIRITGVASPELGEKRIDSLSATGLRLSEFARHLNLNFEFRHAPVALDDPTLSADMFRVEEGEVVIVNFMLELCNLLDGAAETAVFHTLHVAAKLCPRVVTVAEMDAQLNVGPFQKRFVSALHFFSAMFDSLEAGMNRDSMHRLCMERWLLGERIHTMVGGQDEGPWRRRLQTHADWRTALQAANFQPQPLSHYAVSQARILLWRFCESFTLNEQQGSLCLGWQNKPLLNVSAWTTING